MPQVERRFLSFYRQQNVPRPIIMLRVTIESGPLHFQIFDEKKDKILYYLSVGLDWFYYI